MHPIKQKVNLVNLLLKVKQFLDDAWDNSLAHKRAYFSVPRGEEIIDSLGDEVPGKALLHLVVFSIFFQIFNSVYKKMKNERRHSVNDYAQSLRNSRKSEQE